MVLKTLISKKKKLDILGEAFHLLSRKAPKLFPCEPYSVEKRSAINLPPFTKPVPQITVSNPELSQAFQSITDFDLLYLVNFLFLKREP